MILSHILPPFSGGIASLMAPMPFLATVVAEDSPIILSGVLLTLAGHGSSLLQPAVLFCTHLQL
ncbi:hypothetical protein BST81_10310 [Leptolyngbya sp. 'hensonii']|nr:hypothetical protein BST81_10310 [Leptolyngbya sp. 'hensonii']